MTVAITGKLTKAANEFQAGESVGFGLRLGERYYDRETKSNEWTNYEFVVFAKAPAQIDFYRQALVEGAIVEVSGKQQKIKQFISNSGDTHLSIEIIDASIGFVSYSDSPQPSASPSPKPSAPQSPKAPGMPQAPSNQYVMTDKAEGFSREDYIKMGWTDKALIDGGYMLDDGTPF